MESRLDIEAPELAARLRRANVTELRTVAASVASLAVKELNVQDPRIDAGLQAVAAQVWGDAEVRARLQQLTDELDEVAWDIQDQIDPPALDGYQAAFRRARAVESLFFSLDTDPLTAACESAYAAFHALADLELAHNVIDQALTPRG
jgi:hypothetical protein